MALACFVAALAAACGDDDGARVGVMRQALDAPIAEAYCVAQVDGVGEVDAETDYLPHVVACENGGAELEALKAQAIAARSVLYWTLGTNGSICDGQGCQVYSCGNTPSALVQQAVDETSGQYLAYNGNVTYGFYVNGDVDTAPPGCVGNPSASNENWVTYNDGLSGTAVAQTPLGFQHATSDAGYGQNRGCMGQWGARCLESVGRDHDAIMRFYYGADIEVLKADGPCIIPDEPMGGGGAGGEAGSGGAVGVGGDELGEGGSLTVLDAPARGDGGCACRNGAPAGRDVPWAALPVLGLWVLRRSTVSRRRARATGC
jgi:hypothetical protein